MEQRVFTDRLVATEVTQQLFRTTATAQQFTHQVMVKEEEVHLHNLDPQCADQ